MKREKWWLYSGETWQAQTESDEKLASPMFAVRCDALRGARPPFCDVPARKPASVCHEDAMEDRGWVSWDRTYSLAYFTLKGGKDGRRRITCKIGGTWRDRITERTYIPRWDAAPEMWRNSWRKANGICGLDNRTIVPWLGGFRRGYIGECPCLKK